MATYKYTAISKDGVKVSGVVEGFNEFDAVDRIKQDCDIVLKLTEVEEKKPGLLSMEIGGNRPERQSFFPDVRPVFHYPPVRNSHRRTVRLIGDKMTDKKLKGILKKVAEDVEAGRSVATSFQERGGKLLPAVFIETIRAGEESGNLSKAFETMYQLMTSR